VASVLSLSPKGKMNTEIQACLIKFDNNTNGIAVIPGNFNGGSDLTEQNRNKLLKCAFKVYLII
jgi:hypothetical protein